MERITPRRLRRLEAGANEALLQRHAAQMAAELGGPAHQYVPELRRIHGVIGRVMRQLPPMQRHDPEAVARALAAAEGVDPVKLLAEAKRLAREHSQ